MTIAVRSKKDESEGKILSRFLSEWCGVRCGGGIWKSICSLLNGPRALVAWVLVMARILMLLVLGSLLALSGAQASVEERVIGLRSNHSSVLAFCEQKPSCRIVSSQTKEFESGNTFVVLGEDVFDQSIEVLLPLRLTPNDLMEALVKVRTLKTSGARHVFLNLNGRKVDDISVHSRDGKREFRSLPLEKLFSAAGADISGSYSAKESSPSNSGLFAATRVRATSHPRLGVEFARALGVEILTEAKPSKAAGANILLVAPPSFPSNDSFVEGLNEASLFVALGARVVFVTPYLPYARLDKVDQPGITVGGRLVADLIEAVGVHGVAFVRAHAPQSQGYFRIPSFHVSGRETINQFLRAQKADIVIAPDAGAQKDATLYADGLRVPIGVINKQRDPLTGDTRLVDLSGPDVQGKTLAIIDDETASGGTLAQAAEFLKKKGAGKVIAVVTHLAGSGAKAFESSHIDIVAVTDTLPVTVQHPKLSVLSIAPELAKALSRYVDSSRRCRDALGSVKEKP